MNTWQAPHRFDHKATPPLPATGSFDLFQSWKQKFERKPCSRAGYPSSDVSILLHSFLFTSSLVFFFFFHFLVDQQIISASFKISRWSRWDAHGCIGVFMGFFVLHLYHEVNHRRLSPLKPAHLWRPSQASRWCFTVRSLRKSHSVKAKETCLSSRECVARRPHHMSLAGEALFCFGSQSSPDVERGSSQMDVSLVSLSMDAWTQKDVSARCYTKAIKEIYLLKRRGTTCFFMMGGGRWVCYCEATAFEPFLRC